MTTTDKEQKASSMFISKEDYSQGHSVPFQFERSFTFSLRKSMLRKYDVINYQQGFTNYLRNIEDNSANNMHISDNKEKIKNYYGEVEKIENEIAILCLRDSDDSFIEYIIKLSNLEAVNADYEGAPVKLAICEDGNKTSIEVELLRGVEPLWHSPNEDLIHVLQRLKRT